MDDELYKKCLETYWYQSPSARGGGASSIIVHHARRASFDIPEITGTLLLKLRVLDLSDFEGENAEKFCFFRSAHCWLSSPDGAQGSNPSNKGPESVSTREFVFHRPEFSDVFHSITTCHILNPSVSISPNKILSLAESNYSRLQTEDEWHLSA
jgi:hypothetical protein